MHLSRFLQFVILFGTGSFAPLLISCGDDQIDVPDTPLAGKIAGSDWEYKFGSASVFSSDGNYRYLLLSTQEVGDDPCPIVSTSKPHLEMILPLAIESYSLPLFGNNSVKFVFGNGTVLSASAGFLEIIAIDPDSRQILGYLKADFDDDNAVLGTFIVEIC